MKTPSFLLGLCAAGLLAACAPVKQYEADNFGHSVRHMIQAQTHNPAAATQADPGSPIDGEKATTAVKNYRTDKYSRTTTSTPVDMSIDQ